jgi:ubiquinone biosynthesis protein
MRIATALDGDGAFAFDLKGPLPVWLLWHAPMRALSLVARLALFGARVLVVRVIGRGRGDVGWASLAESLGATFIKIGQLLSMRPDLVGAPVATELGRLRARVRPVRAQAIVDAVERSLGAPLADWFESFDRQALAAGAVAQVHAARTRDGQAVAVKVVRPGVARRIAADLRLLYAGAAVIEWLPFGRYLPARALIRELGAALLAQLDLGREADQAEDLRARLGDCADLLIPRVVRRLSTAAVLTTDLVPDLPRGPAADAPPAPSPELAALVRRGLRLLYRMIFIEGRVHADLHRGNIHFGPGRRVVMLDFGLVATLAPEEVTAFRSFFLAMVTGDGARCAAVLRETASGTGPRFSPAGFEGDVAALVAGASGQRAAAFEVGRFVASLFDIQRRWQLRGSTAFTMTLVALLSYEGVAKSCAPELDFQAEAQVFIAEVIAEGAVRASA